MVSSFIPKHSKRLGSLRLGSFYLVFDLDGHTALQRAVLPAVLAKLRAAFPKGAAVASPRGVHFYVFFRICVRLDELVPLAELALYRLGIMDLEVGGIPVQVAEIRPCPGAGSRLPFGPGSYLLEPGFDALSPVSTMVEWFLERARNPVLGTYHVTDAFDPEIARARRRGLTHKELLRAERDAHGARLSAALRKLRSFQPGPYEDVFNSAPAFVKDLWEVGIPKYGTRQVSTHKIARWLAGCGRTRREVVDIIHWWLKNRVHASTDLEDDPAGVLRQTKVIIRKAVASGLEARRKKTVVLGTVALSDVEDLILACIEGGKLNVPCYRFGFKLLSAFAGMAQDEVWLTYRWQKKLGGRNYISCIEKLDGTIFSMHGTIGTRTFRKSPNLASRGRRIRTPEEGLQAALVVHDLENLLTPQYRGKLARQTRSH